MTTGPRGDIAPGSSPEHTSPWSSEPAVCGREVGVQGLSITGTLPLAMTVSTAAPWTAGGAASTPT